MPVSKTYNSQTEVDPDFTFSRLTRTYCYRLKTVHGQRIINTGCTNLKQAKLLIEESQAKNLQVAANVVRFTHEVISQLTVGRKSLKIEDVLCEYLEWYKTRYSAEGMGVQTQFFYGAIKRLDLKKKYITDITEEVLSADINPDDERVSEATRQKRLSKWQNFYKWFSNKYPYRNVASMLRMDHRKLTVGQRCGQRKPHHVLPNEDFEKVLAHVRSEYDRLLIARKNEIERCMVQGGRTRLDLRKINMQIDMAVFHTVAFLVARFTGLRMGDIVQLEWATVDEALLGQIKLWTKKTNTKIEIPCPERVQEAFLMVPRTGPYVFPEMRAAYLEFKITNKTCAVRFYRYLRYYYTAAGIPKFAWHDLRHTFITEVERKHGIKLAKEWAGHRSTEQTEQYVHREARIEAPMPTWEGMDLCPPPCEEVG